MSTFAFGVAGWREDMTPPAAGGGGDPELQLAKPKPPPVKLPEMPWKKKPPAGPSGSGQTP